MSQFRHKVVMVPKELAPEDATAVLDRYGSEGWNLVAFNDGMAYFQMMVASQPSVEPVEAEVYPEKQQQDIVTSQAAGTKSAAHQHRARIELNPDKSLVPTVTDDLPGHSHKITRADVTETADGHTHTFEVT